MPASFVNARYVGFSTSEITGVDLSAALDLGTIAPGTSFGEPDVTTADGFGIKAAVAAGQDITVITYGDTVIEDLVTAANGNPPTGGWLYVVNGSKTRADRFAVRVVSAEAWPVGDDEARARVRYQFYANSDTVADYHSVTTGVIVLPAAT